MSGAVRVFSAFADGAQLARAVAWLGMSCTPEGEQSRNWQTPHQLTARNAGLKMKVRIEERW
jgi:hypothetical protein